MNPILRNILAVILGFVVGSAVNMGLVLLGHQVFPPPIRMTSTEIDYEAIRAIMPTLDVVFFIFPFLAHAIGTLVGAIVAVKIAASRKQWFAYGIAAFFMLGGITNVVLMGAPRWFAGLDIICAYIPMGWLALKLDAKSLLKR